MVNTEKIKKRINELGMTQGEIAKIISVATPTICQKINNIRPFSLEEAEKVAEILRISDGEFKNYFFVSDLRYANYGGVNQYAKNGLEQTEISVDAISKSFWGNHPNT